MTGVQTCALPICCWLVLLTLKAKIKNNTKAPDQNVIVIFNSYGRRLGEFAVLLSLATGRQYKRIKLTNLNQISGGLYINGDAILIGPQNVINNIEHLDLGLENSYDIENFDPADLLPVNDFVTEVRIGGANPIRGVDTDTYEEFKGIKLRQKNGYWKKKPKTPPYGPKPSRRGKRKKRKAIFLDAPRARGEGRKIHSPVARATHYNQHTMSSWTYWQKPHDISWTNYRRWRMWTIRLGFDFYSVLIKLVIHSKNGDHNG